MKKILFLIIIFCALKANAQTYNITFTGTGASASVATVTVENLTEGTSVSFNGSQLLHLNMIVTNINSIESKKSSQIMIYPNPTTDNSVIQIYPPAEGNAAITVSDMNGKQLAQIQCYLENCIQEFRLSGINSGLYIISVKGRTYQYSGKLLCNGKSNRTISIEKVSNNIQVADKKVSNAGSKAYNPPVDMAYTTGDWLKFTGISGNYSTVITDIPTSDKIITFNFIACTDGDNNNYPVVSINTQTWMAGNLKTTKYRNGVLIGTTTPATLNISGESTPEYQWAYDGDESNVAIYGRLYTWYAVTDSRKVCPTGWHMPTDAEWATLTTYLGGISVAGGKMKETGTAHWTAPNSGATNESGFTALPGGIRTGDSFGNINAYGFWWSSVEETTDDAFPLVISSNAGSVNGESYAKRNGFSVRCIEDVPSK